MAKKKAAPDAPPALPPHPGSFPVAAPVDVNAAALVARVDELEGDLVRIVDLLVKGDLDSAKFREILAKRQGKAKA